MSRPRQKSDSVPIHRAGDDRIIRVFGFDSLVKMGIRAHSFSQGDSWFRDFLLQRDILDTHFFLVPKSKNTKHFLLTISV